MTREVYCCTGGSICERSELLCWDRKVVLSAEDCGLDFVLT
jgi:hypothetical protein